VFKKVVQMSCAIVPVATICTQISWKMNSVWMGVVIWFHVHWNALHHCFQCVPGIFTLALVHCVGGEYTHLQ